MDRSSSATFPGQALRYCSSVYLTERSSEKDAGTLSSSCSALVPGTVQDAGKHSVHGVACIALYMYVSRL